MFEYRQQIVVLASWCVAFAVFVIDIVTPVGVEVWVLYLPVIVTAAWFNDARSVVVSAVVSSALVVVGTFVSPPGANPPWWDLLNRGMGLTAISLTAWMGTTICRRSTRLAETAAALKASDERLQLAVQGSGMGTWDVDVSSGVGYWSDATFQMLGYQPIPSPFSAMEMWRHCVLPDDLPRIAKAQEQARRDHSLYSCEYQIRRADTGEVAWLSALGRYRYDELGNPVRFAGVSFDVTLKKRLERETLDIAAREQTRIGQELHDGLGQELTGLGLMATTLVQLLSPASKERQIADRLVGGFDRVHQQARTLARGLIPVHVEVRGLAAALEEMTARVSEQAKVRTSFRCDTAVTLSDHAAATQLFHIAQEAVSNAIRHSQARTVAVTLYEEPEGVSLAIRDDGTGISSQVPDQGLGLRIMKYRADQIGGTLNIGPANGGGTLVTCTLMRSSTNGR